MMAQVPRLILTWAALLALLALTIAASFLPLGALLPAVSYAIATAKAGLVVWQFMDLRREGWLARLAVLAGYAWLALLLLFIAADVAGRG